MNEKIQSTVEKVESEDQRTRTFRAQRLQELLDLGLAKYVRPIGGTWEATFAFQEAVDSYVNGTFMGCILLSQACLEQMLSAHLVSNGEKGLSGKRFDVILKRALERKNITKDEFDLFVDLKTRRNPYTHYRPPSDKDKLVQRAVASDETIMGLIYQDARKAIRSLVQMCRRTPFAEPYLQ